MDNDYLNVNALFSDWVSKKQYEFGSNYPLWERGSQRFLISDYKKCLLDNNIASYWKIWDFWELFEIFISVNLLSEWVDPRYTHSMSEMIISNLHSLVEKNGIISILAWEIRYVWIQQPYSSSTWGGINIQFLKNISNTIFEGNKKIEIINLELILKKLVGERIFDLFKILSWYKKPNTSFAFISLDEIEPNLVEALLKILTEHAEKYNLGETYVSTELANLEKFLNNFWSNAFWTYSR